MRYTIENCVNVSGSGNGGGSSSGPTGDMGLFDDPVGFFNGGTQGPFGQMLSGILSGPGLQNFYDPNRSFAQNALDPRGIEQAMNIGAGFAMPIKAYHGSPYDFTKFDASKIGTGEGAQAYGHGLYFAESPQVAESYKTAGGSHPSSQAFHWWAKSGQDWDNALAKFDEWVKTTPVENESRFSQDAVSSLRQEMQRYAQPGRTYEVNINAEPDQFLNWDKPLSEQPSPAKDLYRELGMVGPDFTANDINKISGGSLGQSFTVNSAGYGKFTPPEFSQRMSQAGIPGIRYLDQGSRGSGQGTSNYVVFDPSIVDILKKYGLAGMTLGGGSMFMDGKQ